MFICYYVHSFKYIFKNTYIKTLKKHYIQKHKSIIYTYDSVFYLKNLWVVK